MSPELSVQKVLLARLVGSDLVTAIVPAENILDRNSRPAPNPSIILGEDQAVDAGLMARNGWRVYSTLHVWAKEPGLVMVKTVAAAIRLALRDSVRSAPDGAISELWEQSNWWVGAQYHFGDCLVSSTRFLRDPDGETAHAVVTVETLVSEAS